LTGLPKNRTLQQSRADHYILALRIRRSLLTTADQERLRPQLCERYGRQKPMSLPVHHTTSTSRSLCILAASRPQITVYLSQEHRKSLRTTTDCCIL